MRLPKNLGIVLTAIWLMGVIGLGILHFGALDTIEALLGIAAGMFALARTVGVATRPLGPRSAPVNREASSA